MSGENTRAVHALIEAINRGDIEAGISNAVVMSFNDGRLVAHKDYGDRDKALAAAGLPS